MRNSELGPLSAVTSVEAGNTLLDRAKGILLDWDGCTATANRPRADALAFIARYKSRIAIVSNNSTNLPEDIAAILAKSNIDFPRNQIFLAGTEAIAFTAETERSRVMVLGAPRMKAHARNIGIELVRTDASVVVLLRDTKFSYTRLERAVASLARGARLIVANPDNTHPGPSGTIVPETGALLAAINACINLSQLDVQYIGKPSRILFQRACAALNIIPQSAVMVGDNIHTDIEGADRLGMPSILVAPGSELLFNDLINAPQAQHLAAKAKARHVTTPRNTKLN
jgi:4-nitrophenyl phosphatase